MLGSGSYCALAIAALASLAQAGPMVADLRAEYLTDPLGLGTAWPRLSWRIDDPAAARGTAQSAYRVTAASSRDDLLAGRADLWDSGRVTSVQSVGIEYAGRPLRAGQMVFWRVQVWDQAGRVLPPSAPARFSVGLLAQADWQAKWVGMASADENACPWLRREFDLERVPAVALASVGSMGFHELWVNGQRVGDAVLTPSVCDLRKRALYLTYDIAPYLKPGRNAVGLWIAPGWTQFSDANPDKVNFNVAKKPLAIAQLQLGQRVLGTDASWRCAQSTTRHLGRWQNSDFGGDRVDAGRELPGWCAPGLDDQGWEAATVYDTGRALTPDVIEPNRLSEPIAAKEMREVSPGKWRFAMARLYAGWVQVKLKGKPGSQVTIKASSLGDREVEYNQLNEYVLGASGEGVFRNRFSYHEVAFVTVEGLDHAPELGDVVGYQVTNARRRAGGFDCSDPLLKRIYDVTAYTYDNLSTGGMTVDCPHRERLGYGGDGHTSLEIAVDSFWSAPFMAKWAQDWCDMQGRDGRIYHTAPTMGGGGGPAWSGFILTMPWEVYQTYGDRRILERTYPYARRWLDFMEAHVGSDGLVQPLPGGYWLFLGDWVTPHGSEGSDKPEAALFNNCYYAYVTRIAERIARLLGHEADASLLATRYERVKAGINQRFLNEAAGTYLDTRQTHLVMPLVAGVVPPERLAQVQANLEHEILTTQNGHVDTGLHGTYFMTRYLTDIGRSDLVRAYATQTTPPSYGALLAAGYETWPEEWRGSASRLHGCLNGIGGWFQRGLAGIRADEESPGYQRFVIRPATPTGLDWVKGYHESPYGRIESAWRREAGGLALEVTVPPNAWATLYLPTTDRARVTEGGRPVRASAGVTYLREDDGAAVYQLASGRYRFLAP